MMIMQFFFLIFFIKAYVVGTHLNCIDRSLGHFVSSPREREKRDRRDSRGDEKRGTGKKEEQE